MGDNANSTSKQPAPLPSAATFAVVVLTAMNLLNYLDRYVPSAVKDLFKRDLGLSDAQTSYPLMAFVVVYMLTSPVFGSLGDRWSRKALISTGVALWSLATAGAALATGFWSFLAARALVGVGEAAYATISPSLLSDFYPPSRRNRILTVFYLAIPVGSALGFLIGGAVGGHWGWRAAFLVCGLPGLAVAALAMVIREPRRGGMDAKEESAAVPAWPAALRLLARNREYVIAVAGYTAVTFAAGGMADWYMTFLVRHRGMGLAESGGLMGPATVLGGLGGTLIGGLLADWMRKKTRNPYFALSALSMIPATLFAVAALLARDRTAIFVCILLAQFFLWFYNGPINAILVNSVAANMRARAFSLSILSIHILGDAISPSIIGSISDRTGNLFSAMFLIPAAMALGAALWAAGWAGRQRTATRS